MLLSGKGDGMTLRELAKYTPRSRQVEEFFFANARYVEDSPSKPYIIRIGSMTLFDEDTMGLRLQLERMIATARRRKARS
jgi:hypothetical protein